MTSIGAALARLAKTGGPRCCKRDAFAAMEQAVGYIAERYGVKLSLPEIVCDFYPNNRQCIGNKCPFDQNHKENKI